MPHLVKKGFLTTCLTTDSFGTHGNSGVKRCGEYAETSRNYRKWPEMYRKNLVQPFGSVMPAAWASAFRPLRSSLFGANYRFAARLLGREFLSFRLRPDAFLNFSEK